MIGDKGDVGHGQFYWFVGVVEDRNDPEEMGRVKVRIYGLHSDDKTLIPTESLPWSMVMMPITSASLGGVGQSATGIVQGSWVFGYFLDAESMQKPFVMGTLPSRPYIPNFEKGFNDPENIHPVRYGDDQVDTPHSARREEYKKHISYQLKDELRQLNIPIAIAPKVDTVGPPEADSFYERTTWNMPEVQQGKEPVYPFNKVTETESGHVLEVDDTPGNNRISQFHASGSNWEIQDNGDETITIVGDKYSVVFGSENIYVKGSVNMTVEGDYKQLVKGNYFLEVEGDKHEKILGNRQTKIKFNDLLEVGQDVSTNITNNKNLRVGVAEIRSVEGDRTTTIGANENLIIKDDLLISATGETTIFSGKKMNVSSLKDMKISVSGNQTIKADLTTIQNPTDIVGDTNITGNATVSGTTTSTGEVTGNGIALSSHTHTDSAGLGAGTTTPPN
jgi:hypothetical protein